MNAARTGIAIFAFCAAAAAGPWLIPAALAMPLGPQTSEATGGAATARHIGAIKAIAGNVITLTPDSGPEIAVAVQAATQIVRIAPGEKTLKNATPVQLQDLQVGDRILVAGTASDTRALAAASIVVMKRSDVEARQEQERQDWQKRGLGGLVKAVDPTAGTATISVTGFGGAKTIVIHASKDTVVRRYAPDSMKFDDARPSTLQEIRPGDQLRARGNRSPDGTELAAEEIVTGSFRNVAGIVSSVDAGAGTLSVQDLLSKKLVQVRVTAESQLHQLPPEMAQRIAMRLKAAMAGAMGGAQGPGASASAPANAPGNGGSAPAGPGGPPSGGARRRKRGLRGNASRRRSGLPANTQPHARRCSERSAQRRRRDDRRHRGHASGWSHRHYPAERCRADPAGGPQRKPGHDDVALESGRAHRRRCPWSIKLRSINLGQQIQVNKFGSVDSAGRLGLLEASRGIDSSWYRRRSWPGSWTRE